MRSHRTVVDRRIVAARVLRGNLALAERRVCELPVPGAIADGVNMRDVGAPRLVGADAGAPVELDAGGLEPDALDERAATDRDEHQVCLHRLAVAEMHRELGAVVVHLRALLAEL